MGNIPTRFTARSPRTTLVSGSSESAFWQGPFQRSQRGLNVLFPDGFRDWFFVNSLTAPAESTLFGHVGGMHHIYVNAKGLSILQKPVTRSPIPMESSSRTTFTTSQ